MKRFLSAVAALALTLALLPGAARAAGYRDAFGRPLTLQYVNGEYRYAVDDNKLLAIYTGGVCGRDLYDLLGISALQSRSLTYKVDGVSSGVINKSSINASNTAAYSTTGNGVLTEIFLDGTELIIVTINTYLAEAAADFDASTGLLYLFVYGGPVESGSMVWDGSKYPYTFLTPGMKTQYCTVKAVSSADFPLASYLLAEIPLIVNMADSNGDGVYEITNLSIPSFTVNMPVTQYAADYLISEGTRWDYCKNVYFYPEYSTGAPNPLSYYNSDAFAHTYNVVYDPFGYVIGVQTYQDSPQYAVNGSVSNGIVSATVTAPAGSLLIAASYDASGRLRGTNTTPISEECRGTVYRLTPPAGSYYKLMLVDRRSCAPLCAAYRIG